MHACCIEYIVPVVQGELTKFAICSHRAKGAHRPSSTARRSLGCGAPSAQRMLMVVPLVLCLVFGFVLVISLNALSCKPRPLAFG